MGDIAVVQYEIERKDFVALKMIYVGNNGNDVNTRSDDIQL
jgi:hypothetical protein